LGPPLVPVAQEFSTQKVKSERKTEPKVAKAAVKVNDLITFHFSLPIYITRTEPKLAKEVVNAKKNVR
jgi:hypothetical protein